MPTQEYDYVIIGQGLAGSILAYCLIQRGLRVMVIDNHHYASASKVAAGIINPITGHRLNLTLNYNHLYRVATSFYGKLDREFNTNLVRAIVQHRLIKNLGQFDYYQQRLTQPDYHPYLARRDKHPALFKSPIFGSIEVLQSAIVDTKSLLKNTRTWLMQQASYTESQLDYGAIQLKRNGFEINGVCCNRLIFCEGHQSMHNPWLKHLPFKLSKGEILNVQFDGGQPTDMLNWGNWLIPDKKITLPENQQPTSIIAKLGSNYDWRDLSLNTNIKTQIRLLNSLHQHTKLKATLLSSEVGIRPTTTQRKPFVGPSSKLAGAYCFNGFGSKGCLLIPYYAQLLGNHLIDGKPLPREITQWL